MEREEHPAIVACLSPKCWTGRRQRAIIRLFLLGLTPREVGNLTVADRSPGFERLRVGGRVLELPPAARHDVLRWFYRDRWTLDGAALFCTRTGRPLLHANLHRMRERATYSGGKGYHV